MLIKRKEGRKDDSEGLGTGSIFWLLYSFATRGQCCVTQETKIVVRAYKDGESQVLLSGGVPDVEW